MKRAIKNHLGDFIAIIVLLVLAIGASGYILTKERLHFPFVASPIKLKAAFQTAQAFTPGQGQTVRVSGVEIGEVGQVQIQNGVAVVEMDIQPKYKDVIHTDATAIARPRTGLQDMFIEVDPGSYNAPIAKQGWTMPVSNTQPEVNPDEVLASLDADTRSYLDLLINGAGQGLSNNGGNELAGVLERFEPTHRDLARLNGAVAQRGAALQHLINSLQRLNTALAAKSAEIVSLIDASAKVFHAFATVNQSVSRAVADLPGTLQQTTITLQKVTTFANLLGTATHDLIPAAQALPAANEAQIALARPATPIVQNQIRPFVIAARPFVQHLRPVANNLNQAQPSTTKDFAELNRVFNMLAFNPGGGQHGYLWWWAWLNHEVRTLFSIQDANGPFRPVFLQASCDTYSRLLGFNPSAVAVLSPALASACNLP